MTITLAEEIKNTLGKGKVTKARSEMVGMSLNKKLWLLYEAISTKNSRMLKQTLLQIKSALKYKHISN